MALPDDRYFSPDPAQKRIAHALYTGALHLPLICPHGHVDPRMFTDPDYSFGTPADLLIIPDHYIYRMLYSRGIALERLGIPRLDGSPVETDHKKIWQLFADNFYLFRGTPTGMWLTQELHDVFGVEVKLTSETAQAVYEQIDACLASPDFRPRTMFERFKIEVLCTTDLDQQPGRAPGDPGVGLAGNHPAYFPPRRTDRPAYPKLAQLYRCAQRCKRDFLRYLSTFYPGVGISARPFQSDGCQSHR